MYLDHINISAPCEVIDREKAFLMDTLDLVDGEKSSTAKAGYWLYFGERALIHLTFSEEHHSSDKPNYLDHIAFRGANFDGFVQKLLDQQVEHKVYLTPETGERQVFFHTPSGVRLEVNFA